MAKDPSAAADDLISVSCRGGGREAGAAADFCCKNPKIGYDIIVYYFLSGREAVFLYLQIAADEYSQALKQGLKTYRELSAAGLDPHPPVLDTILEQSSAQTVQDIGTLEVPAERIVGTKSAGRIAAFTAGFLPILGPETEFSRKWISLCAAHLGNEGIRDAVECYEYLGNFYVQEGNKRVSILRYFGAPRILCQIRRILPAKSEEPRIRAYYEFLDFYKVSRLYTVQFRRPGDYGKLMAFLDRSPDIPWTEEERRSFTTNFHRFHEAFQSLKTKPANVLPEEALLVWLQLFPFSDLSRLTSTELKKTLSALWEDVLTVSTEAVTLQTKAEHDAKAGFWTRFVTPDHLNVAFVHQLDHAVSSWVQGHEDGVRYLESVFGERISTRSYFGARDAQSAEALLEQAVREGAQVVFATSPPLRRATLKAALKYPKVRFLNCSVDQPYASIRSYYGRIYEAKFITGAIAGAMARDGQIGYIASNPIFGVPASINAFALGAQMTNPEAAIHLRWSCCGGSPQSDFFREGIRVVSNRDVPTGSKLYLDFCNYGTYLVAEDGSLSSLASPVWAWGKFYEFVIRSLLSGTWKEQKGSIGALNYWLGMDSGAIDIHFSDRLPEGVRALAELLQQNMCSGTLDPFRRRITAQDGTLVNDGSRNLSVEELLHMDWLCDNVIGSIPEYSQILPRSQQIVRELGIYRDSIPPGKEAPVENTGDLR